MKCVRYPALAILTFVIGVALSPIRFYFESVACGKGSSTTYRSSYFIQISNSTFLYDSEAEASNAFNKRLSEAITVYDVSPKVNKEGVLITQRAVALFYDQTNGKYDVKSFWREGQLLRTISSRSYTLVMEFQKRSF